MKRYRTLLFTLGLAACGGTITKPTLTPSGEKGDPADQNPDGAREPDDLDEPRNVAPPDNINNNDDLPTPNEDDLPAPDDDPGLDVALPVVPGTDAVVAAGAFVATVRPSDDCLTVTNTGTGAVEVFESLCAPRGIAAIDGAILVLDNAGQSLVRIALPGLGLSLIAATEAVYSGLIVAEDGIHAVLASVPVRPSDLLVWEQSPDDLALRRLAVVHLGTEQVETYITANAIRDVDITGTRIVVTMGYHDKFGLPHAVLQVFNRVDLDYLGAVDFPNCADDLTIHPSELLAVLAPRSCALHDVILAEPEVVETWDDTDWPDPPEGDGDPISFVDIENVKHLANTPGFGPAVFSPDGSQVGGFTQQQALMVEWNLFQQDAFGVIVANTADYTFDLYDAGDIRPRFAFGPDGAFYVEGAREGVPYTAVLDEAAGALQPFSGLSVSLASRATGSDGALYVASGGSLLKLSKSGIETVASGAKGDVITAFDGGLVLTDKGAGTHTVIEISPMTIVRVISL